MRSQQEKEKSRELKRIPITESTASKMELQASECTPHHAWFTEGEASGTCFGRRLVGDKTAEDGWVDTRIEMLGDGMVADMNIEKTLLTMGEGSWTMRCAEEMMVRWP